LQGQSSLLYGSNSFACSRNALSCTNVELATRKPLYAPMTSIDDKEIVAGHVQKQRRVSSGQWLEED
jgi:hypothetical protein